MIFNYGDANFFLFEEIVKKNFATKYMSSVLGILWSVLRPLLVMILLTIIFSTVFGRRIENFPVYYLTGKVLFDFFTSGVRGGMSSLRNNENILNKASAPKYIFVLAAITSEFLNLLISFIILIFVMIVTKAPFHFNTIPFAIIPLISLICMVIGFGLAFSIFNVYYNDIIHLWGVFVMMLMYASAIFYPMDIIPLQYRKYMILNPMFWIIDQFRHFVIYGTFPDLLNVINLVLLSLIILVFGIIIFRKYQNNILMKF